VNIGWRIHLNSLGELACEIGIAVTGVKLHRVAAGEDNVLHFAHLCGWSNSTWTHSLLSFAFRVLDEAGLMKAKSLPSQDGA